MSDTEAADAPQIHDAPCSLAWCTTAHGATLHPQDEDHRSDGREVILTLHDRQSAGGVRRIAAEVGLLRRAASSQTWLVLEDGRSLDVEIAIESARDLLRALAADPPVARALGVAERPA